MKRILFVLLLPLLGLFGCGGGDPPPAKFTPEQQAVLDAAQVEFDKAHTQLCNYGCGGIPTSFGVTSLGVGIDMSSGRAYLYDLEPLSSGGFTGDYVGGVDATGENASLGMSADPTIGPQTNVQMHFDDLGRVLQIYTDPFGTILRTDITPIDQLPTNPNTGRVYVPVKRRYFIDS